MSAAIKQSIAGIMGSSKEPLDVDFCVQSKPLTQKEREAISANARKLTVWLPTEFLSIFHQ